MIYPTPYLAPVAQRLVNGTPECRDDGFQLVDSALVALGAEVLVPGLLPL